MESKENNTSVEDTSPISQYVHDRAILDAEFPAWLDKLRASNAGHLAHWTESGTKEPWAPPTPSGMTDEEYARRLQIENREQSLISRYNDSRTLVGDRFQISLEQFAEHELTTERTKLAQGGRAEHRDRGTSVSSNPLSKIREVFAKKSRRS